MMHFVRKLFPTRALAALLAIGLADLVATALLHRQGLIEELNPLMAPLLGGDQMRFVAVKMATLLAAWLLLARTARTDLKGVRRACLGGSAAYLATLFLAFSAG
ncbi:hypothetical protein EON82_04040 [bacterium]|nr:MAG: hypothetical protein EON82_04040 [bacterium]